MKLFIPASVVAALSLIFASTSDAALLLKWNLDESSGTVAADSSGNGIDGAWQGTVGSPGWAPAGGISGGAISFTGANLDSFITTSFSAVSGTPFTVSFWVKTVSTENDGLAYVGNGSGSSYYVVRLTTNVARVSARNTTEIQAAGTTAINNDAWHHIVGVYASDSSRTLYVDGVSESTNTTLVNPVPLSRFGIGALTRNTPYNPADLFTGMMDDVQLYSGALTQSDITFLAANPGVAVPEASTASLLGLIAAAGCRRRRRS